MSNPTPPTRRHSSDAYVETTFALTDSAALKMLNAAREAAVSMKQPQCIVIVDSSGVAIAEFRMRGAKFISLKSAKAKARTAASIGSPSAAVADAVSLKIAAATGGDITALPGGLPIRFEGTLVGGIGIGSGSGDQDVEVARAALAAIGADPI